MKLMCFCPGGGLVAVGCPAHWPITLPAQGSETPPRDQRAGRTKSISSTDFGSHRVGSTPPSAGEGELDTIDTLTRDACSVGYYGPKSVYRKRLNAYIARRVLEVIGEDEINDHEATEFMVGRAKKIRNRLRAEQRQRIAAIKKESQQ